MNYCNFFKKILECQKENKCPISKEYVYICKICGEKSSSGFCWCMVNIDD